MVPTGPRVAVRPVTPPAPSGSKSGTVGRSARTGGGTRVRVRGGVPQRSARHEGAGLTDVPTRGTFSPLRRSGGGRHRDTTVPADEQRHGPVRTAAPLGAHSHGLMALCRTLRRRGRARDPRSCPVQVAALGPYRAGYSPGAICAWRCRPGSHPGRRTPSASQAGTAHRGDPVPGRGDIRGGCATPRTGGRTEATARADRPVGWRAGSPPPCTTCSLRSQAFGFSRAWGGAPGRTAPRRRRRRQAGRPGRGW